MKMLKRLAALVAVATAALIPLTALAQAQLVKGRDYAVIEPALPTDTPEKIEVTEFFSYACPHCNDLNPLIHDWAAKLPADVVFKRIALPGSPFYALMSKLYYTLEATGDVDRLDSAVFNAIHGKGLKLIDAKSITTWVTSQGVDAQKFTTAFNSFGVDSKVKRAGQVAQQARIQGVPALVVDGRFTVVGQNVKSFKELLALTDKVIEMRRKERAQKK